MNFFFWIRIFVLVVMFFYTQWKISHIFLMPLPIAFAVTFAYFLLMIGWMFVYRLMHVSEDTVRAKCFIWVGSLAMALWATFMIFHLMSDIVTIFIGDHISFLVKNFSAGVLGLSVLLVGAGVVQALRGAKVKKVKVLSDKITKKLNGLKIAQISDLHVGLTIEKEYIQDVVTKTMAEKPDMIVITGDIADGTPEGLKDRAAPLADLKAPLGIFYCVGNHEYYWGVDKWVQQVKDFGFVPLLNENRIVHFNGEKLMIAGVTDTSSHQFVPEHVSDAVKAAQTTESPQFKILLAHRPQSYEQAEKANFDLQLSGHTHAGQFFPFNLFIPFFHRYYRGLNKRNNLQIYVNQGTGYWGPANRLAVPSEITILELLA